MRIDFHTHILPGIDDGSKDIDMTEKMLEAELEQGVSHIFATPHFYAHRRSIDSFIERRAGAMAKTEELLRSRPELPSITPGAEVYYFSGIGKAGQIEELCMQGSRVLLLELPFDQWHRDVCKDIDTLIEKRGLAIVLAHLDRYERFQKDRTAWNTVIEMPLTIQLNCESILEKDSWLRRNHRHSLCMSLLEEKENVIIGSDCHNLTDRAPNIAAARDVIEKECGAGRLRQLNEYTEKLLMGEGAI